MSLKSKQVKDEQTIQRENEEKLQKLFQELDYSIENKQFRLSKVICNAILKIDPTNLRVVEYVDKIPDQVEPTTRADIESFIKLAALLMAPGAILFLIFYRFLKKSEDKNSEYFDNLEKKKQGNKSNTSEQIEDDQEEKSETEKKFSTKGFKPHSFNQNKNKFKFSTMKQTPYQIPTFNHQNLHQLYRPSFTPQTYNLQKFMAKVIAKIL